MPNPATTVFTTPIEKPMLEIVAFQAISQHQDAPISLTQTLILLPNRRSCLALRDVFLSRYGDQAGFLPRIQPLGEIDEEELTAEILRYQPEWLERLTDIPPVISDTERLLVTARKIWDSQAKLPMKSMNMEQCSAIAAEVLHLMDELDRDMIDYEEVLKLNSQAFAQHWQDNIAVVKLILRWWPDYLKQHNRISALQRRNQLLLLLADLWQSAPPDHPVIVAGSTGTNPAAAKLMGVIAQLPLGQIIIPGLDTHCSDEVWQQVSETHPQYHIKHLLEALEVDRADVAMMDVDTHRSGSYEHARTLLEANLPAALTHQWHNMPAKDTLPFERIDCQNEWEEAQLVALLLKEMNEQKGSTAALVTHDVQLMQRVGTLLTMDGIAIDNATGASLLRHPVVQWWLLLAELALNPDHPVQILAVLKHSLCRFGELEHSELLLDTLEKQYLRGIRTSAGGVSAIDAIADGSMLSESSLALLSEIVKAIDVLSAAFKGKAVAMSAMLQAHMESFNSLSHVALDEDIAQPIKELQQHAASLGEIDPANYLALVRDCLQSKKWFAKSAASTSLIMLSPIEARLQHYDRIILAGLNEGSWPHEPEMGSWLNESLRKQVGLPPVQAHIAQEAHDFVMLACGKQVFATRAKTTGGAETLPCRWLERLDTYLKKTKDDKKAYSENQYLHWLSEYQRVAELEELEPPAPKPPIEARPKKLSVTQLDRLLRDPYAVYARYVLNLKPLDPIDQDVDAATLGTVIHDILERFVLAVNESKTNLNEAVFLEQADKALKKYDDRPQVALLWKPRLKKMASWVVALEAKRREQATAVKPEQEIETQLDELTLHGRLDRVEQTADGVAIVDYKTGSVPSKKDVSLGYAAQLFIEAMLMAEQVEMVEYWKVGSGIHKPEMTSFKDDEMQELIAFYDAGIKAMIKRYYEDGAAYYACPVPDKKLSYNDYEHLARIQQWLAA